MNRSHSEMAEILNAMALSKSKWIEDVSEGRYRRSDMDIALAKRDLSALRQAASDYAAAARREAA